MLLSIYDLGIINIFTFFFCVAGWPNCCKETAIVFVYLYNLQWIQWMHVMSTCLSNVLVMHLFLGLSSEGTEITSNVAVTRESRRSPMKPRASPVKSRASPVKSRASSVKFWAMLAHTRASPPMRAPCQFSPPPPWSLVFNRHTRARSDAWVQGNVKRRRGEFLSLKENTPLICFLFLSWWLALMSVFLVWWPNDGGQWREDGSRGEELVSNCFCLPLNKKR